MKAVVDNDSVPPSFLGGRLPPSFTLRVVTIAPGGSRGYEPAEWADAIVVVERGRVEVCCSDGTVLRFGAGDPLWLAGLPILALRNPGEEDAVLTGVRRRRSGLRKMSDLVARLNRKFKKAFDRPAAEE